jgi:hypothetical protein
MGALTQLQIEKDDFPRKPTCKSFVDYRTNTPDPPLMELLQTEAVYAQNTLKAYARSSSTHEEHSDDITGLLIGGLATTIGTRSISRAT